MSSFGRLCKISFPELHCITFPFIPTSSRIIVTGTKQLFVAIRYLFVTMKLLVFETCGRNLICFEKELSMLTSRFSFGFVLCLFFSGQFSEYVAFRVHSFMASTKNKLGEGKIWPMVLMLVHGFWGRFSFRDM